MKVEKKARDEDGTVRVLENAEDYKTNMSVWLVKGVDWRRRRPRL